jgi:hypothetical protein
MLQCCPVLPIVSVNAHMFGLFVIDAGGPCALQWLTRRRGCGLYVSCFASVTSSQLPITVYVLRDMSS